MTRIYVMFTPTNGPAMVSFAGIETSLKAAKAYLDGLPWLKDSSIPYTWKRRQHRGLPCYFAEWDKYPKESHAAIFVCTLEDGKHDEKLRI